MGRFLELLARYPLVTNLFNTYIGEEVYSSTDLEKFTVDGCLQMYLDTQCQDTVEKMFVESETFIADEDFSCEVLSRFICLSFESRQEALNFVRNTLQKLKHLFGERVENGYYLEMKKKTES